MSEQARPASVEIIERTGNEEVLDCAVLMPNVVRINGTDVLCSRDHPITIDTGVGRDALVTLTIFARHLVVGFEKE